MTTTTLNRATVSEVRDALEQAMTNVAENFGLTFRIGTIRFTDSNLRCQVELARTSDDGLVVNKFAEEFLRRAPHYGLSGADLGRTFRARSGMVLRITGLNTRATRYPILCEDERGRRIKYAASMIRWLLEQQDPRS